MEFSNSVYTQSVRSRSQSLQWMNGSMDQCSHGHTTCQSHPLAAPNQWPARFIAVSDSHSPNIRPCETSMLKCPTLTYMTLSHCRGNYIPIRLLIASYSEFLNGMELNTLAKTFRDAVEVTRKLGVCYLWIDSLCNCRRELENDFLRMQIGPFCTPRL